MHHIKLIIIGLLLTIPASIFAADVSVSSSGTVAPGATVTLTIAVNNVTDLFGTAFDIQYDPTIISFVSAQKGTFLEQGGVTTTLLTSANNGVLVVGYSRQAIGGVSTGINGSGNVMTLTFNALSSGTSNIAFLNNSLCSSVGFVCTEIPAVWNNTTVTVSGTGTPLDTTPPTITVTEPAGGAIVSGTTVITATANDDVGVAGVQFKQDNVNIGGEDTSSPYSVSLNTTSLGNGAHTLTATARDIAGNTTTSNAITIMVNNIVSDTTAPSIPTNLTATAVSPSQINLSWSPSTDAVGVTGYRIYQGGTQVATSPSTTYSDIALTASTLYTYTISAYDATGNVSAQSTSMSATTQAQTITDGIAPVITSFSIPNTSTSLTVTTSSFVATDAQGVTGYKITETATAPTASDVGWSSIIPTTYVFTNAGSKNLYAWTKDSAGNVSAGVQASVVITLPAPTQTTNSGNTSSLAVTQTTNTNFSNSAAQTTPVTGCPLGFAFSTTTGKPCGSTITTITGGPAPFSPAISPSVSSTSSYLFSDEHSITYGMKNNNDVRELQKVLQREGLLAGTSPVDGSFFLNTKNAVIKFQQKYDITPAKGFVGPITKRKLNELYRETATTSTPTVINTLSSFFFSRNLTIGSRGEDVKKLQQILNADPATRIAQTGAGSPGNETTYFGPATKNAVIRYQQKQGIVPSYGYIGPLTRSRLNGN